MENVHWKFYGDHEYVVLKAMDGAKLIDEIMEHHFKEYGKGYLDELIIIDVCVLELDDENYDEFRKLRFRLFHYEKMGYGFGLPF
ncbi:hypothetical protein ACFYKT_06405 [Cytobacillus sp. FJAT-53684]|uniref:Uncharacterized protein n=1 Tax=Cytobacillus mangrovibacter TaxID=3299024 RepID=A0ABW6JWV5_9BACI